MFKEKEEVDQDIKADIERMRNIHETLNLVEDRSFTRSNLMIPYLNGQASICQAMLEGNLEPEQRYNTLKKKIAYETCMLQFIELPEPKVEIDGENIIDMSERAMKAKETPPDSEEMVAG